MYQGGDDGPSRSDRVSTRESQAKKSGFHYETAFSKPTLVRGPGPLSPPPSRT
jgi:hypothetical protein